MGIVRDLTGQRLGKLLVLSQAGIHENGKDVIWNCVCDCGTTKTIKSKHLYGCRRPARSCGCGATRLINLTGQRFGKLVVLEQSENKGKLVTWKCLCDCGNVRIVESVRLRVKVNPVISCGCTDRYPKHGMSNEKIYRVWASMIDRCTRAGCKHYARYGGRGIKVCERWLKFSNFYEDMGDPPEGYTLERINNDGNYEPSNVRWASIEEQANNKRNNAYFEYDGKRLTLAQWSRLTGIPRYCLKNRLYSYGWSVERALTTPARTINKNAKDNCR